MKLIALNVLSRRPMMQDQNTSDASTAPAWMRLALLGFGLAVLAFLVAIDRPLWFRIIPFTGAALAVSMAADAGERPGGPTRG